MLVILFICPFIFLSHENPSQITHLLLEPVFEFCMQLDNGEVCCVRENQNGDMFSFCPSLPCNREISKYKIMVQLPQIAMAGGM